MIIIVHILWQDHHQKHQHFLVRKKELLFGLAVQHLDLEMVHSHWPTKHYPKSGETRLLDNLKYEKTYEAKGIESVIAKDHESYKNWFIAIEKDVRWDKDDWFANFNTSL